MSGPLVIAGNQAKSAAKNAVRSAEAGIRRETNLVQRASALLGQTAARPKEAKKRALKSGVYVQSQSGSAQVRITKDGYVRRSPVQEVRTDPGFYKKRRKRAIGGIVAFIIIALIAVVLLRYFGIA